MGHTGSKGASMKVLAVLVLLAAIQGYDGAYCGYDEYVPAMKLIGFIKWKYNGVGMDTAQLCHDACVSPGCHYWKFRKGAIRRRRTCSLYEVIQDIISEMEMILFGH